MTRSVRTSLLGALAVAAALVMAGPSAGAAAAEPAELVPNGGFEVAGPTPTTPSGWSQIAWGDITPAFSLPVTGAHGGAVSARIDVPRWVSGAATFAFEPQPVDGGGRYVLSSWYRANRGTEVLAVYGTAAGTVGYQWLADAPPAAEWSPISLRFTAPADAVTVTIYHSIAGVGYLQTDDVSITAYVPPPPPTSLGLVVNGDLESYDPFAPGTPTGWAPAQWGDLQATFTHAETDAHSGARDARVEVTAFTDGGASWSFDPQPVAAGQTYLYDGWYRSNRPTEVLAVLGMDDGSARYAWLGVAPASAAWSQFFGAFTAPAGVSTVTIFQSLTSVGWVEVDDVSVSPYVPVPFARPLVSMTFDDGYRSDVDVALPALAAAGLKATFYVTTGDLDTLPPPSFMRSPDLGRLVAAGMEIGGHTVTHPHLLTMPADQQEAELVGAQQRLQALTGRSVTNFAVPYGEQDEALTGRIMDHYVTSRSVDGGINSLDTLDFSHVAARMVTSTTTVEQVQEWLATTRRQGLWLVLVFHDLIPGATDYDSTPELFQQVVDAVAASGIAVVTMADAHAELAPQRTVAAA